MTKKDGPIGYTSRRKRQKDQGRPSPLVDGNTNHQEYGPDTPVAIYTRVSTDEQAETGLSLSAQERVCRQFADSRDWSVTKVYADPGFSGKNDNRPNFQNMLADARMGRFRILLIHKLDRFSRNIGNTLKNFRELNDCDVTLVSVTEDFDYSTPMGRMFFHMMAVFAQWYLENLSAETSKGKKERIKQGLHNGLLPFGYKNVGPKQPGAVDPEQAKAVKKAFEMYSTGQYSDRDIAQYLNENEFETRRDRNWSKDSAREFLQNDYYYGVVTYKDEIWPGQHEPIISEELFKTCLKVRKSRARTPKSYNTTPKRVYMLQRIIRCDQCERRLRMQSSYKYHYYKEASRARGLECDHAGTSIRTDRADPQVLELLEKLDLPRRWEEAFERLAEEMTGSNKIQKKRQTLEDKLRRLGRVYADRLISDDEYERKRNALRAELDSLVIPDEAIMVELSMQLGDLGPYLEEATVEERAGICHLIFDAVYADVQTDTITRLKPNREFVHIFRLAAEQNGWEEEEPGVFTVNKRSRN